LACSRFAPKLPGIAELFSEEVNIEDFVPRFGSRALAKMLKVSFTQSTLPATVAAAAGEIARQKFGNRFGRKSVNNPASIYVCLTPSSHGHIGGTTNGGRCCIVERH